MSIRNWVSLFALCALATAGVRAQSGASINGTVADAQGGVLPGVTLTLRNVDTGVLRTSVSEADGVYRFAGLPPGRYDLTSELAGFSTVEIKDTTLTIGLEVRRDVKMNIEALQESVTVIGQAPAVETTRSEVAQVVTQQQIESLPVANRAEQDPTEEVLLADGRDNHGKNHQEEARRRREPRRHLRRSRDSVPDGLAKDRFD